MSIQPIVKMGNKQLGERSLELEQFTEQSLQPLITDMVETMRAENGIGIAAPQIGINQRVIVFGLDDCEAAGYDLPLTVLINPTYKILTQDTEPAWEGCLSVPNMRGLVPRVLHIEYQGHAPNGQHIKRTVSGYHARVFLHENDHLDGILYPERILDIKDFGFSDELDEWRF